ncbi:hypothetical protein Tco_0184076 [Tanacetum coccineum]
MTEDEQVLYDDLKKMIVQEVVAKALDDATRQAFEEEKRNIASQKRAAQATRENAGESLLSILRTTYPIEGITAPLKADINNMITPIDVSPIFHTQSSQEEPKNISQALQDESWVEAMQEELLQFKLQKVWVLVDLPYGKKVIGTKWVFRIRKMREVLVVKNNARLEHKGLYRRSTFLYGTIERGGVCPINLQALLILLIQSKVYKVIKALYVFNEVPLELATTPIESNKPLVKDEDGVDVDVHVYRSMIGSLMYLTASRPDIMLLSCLCKIFKSLQKPQLNCSKKEF